MEESNCSPDKQSESKAYKNEHKISHYRSLFIAHYEFGDIFKEHSGASDSQQHMSHVNHYQSRKGQDLTRILNEHTLY